jgi:predicted metal-dependent hydrolase
VPPQSFWQGISEFNRQQFYACHDILEAIWLEAPESDKRFYQGILQIAVACYHLGNLNWRGAVILLGEGTSKLYDYQPAYYQIDVADLLAQTSQLLQQLQQIEPERVAEFVTELDRGINCQLPQIVRL